MHTEVAADGGAGLAGDITLLDLALLLVAQATWPAGDAPSGAEVTDLLPADAIALADFAYWRALLVQGDHLILLRWRKAGVMLAETLRRGECLWWLWLRRRAAASWRTPVVSASSW